MGPLGADRTPIPSFGGKPLMSLGLGAGRDLELAGAPDDIRSWDLCVRGVGPARTVAPDSPFLEAQGPSVGFRRLLRSAAILMIMCLIGSSHVEVLQAHSRHCTGCVPSGDKPSMVVAACRGAVGTGKLQERKPGRGRRSGTMALLCRSLIQMGQVECCER